MGVGDEVVFLPGIGGIGWHHMVFGVVMRNRQHTRHGLLGLWGGEHTRQRVLGGHRELVTVVEVRIGVWHGVVVERVGGVGRGIVVGGNLVLLLEVLLMIMVLVVRRKGMLMCRDRRRRRGGNRFWRGGISTIGGALVRRRRRRGRGC
eukprot:Hpha_TRINITY_DN18537_c0_g1::TRINITY_DN18537_c0_g1_i1::g.195179::m.195179